MKRTEALKPLSREHHHTLFVAKEVRDADEAGAEAARETLLEYWRNEGAPHFRIEEEVLLPGSEIGGPDEDPEVARLLTEHLYIRRQMRLLAAQAEAGEDPDLGELKSLATLMRDHTRFEERELFPRIERELPEEKLIALGEEIEAAEQEAFGGPAKRPEPRD